MPNKIVWDPSADLDVASYSIESGPTYTGAWNPLVSIVHDLTGSNFDAQSGQFFYIDNVSPASTWYRIFVLDTMGLSSPPSVPFQATSVPTMFIPGSTPFGIFDHDPQFQFDADKIVDYTRRKLGEPVMAVHLSSSQIYAAFEEGALEYSAMVNSYQAKSALATLIGTPTGSGTGLENKLPGRTLELQRQLAEAYGEEANLNGNHPLYSGSIELQPGVQNYDLQFLLSGTVGAQRIRVKEIFHKSPLSAYRMFGTNSSLNYLNSQFKFESYTPETMFYLLPIWEDILRGMQFKTSNNVRRSNYSYALHNNVLSIYPTPSDVRLLHFTYQLPPNPLEELNDPRTHGVSNLSNVPFGNIRYSDLNSISRHWIRRMAFAMAKEIEGQIRSKFSTVPIPNGDLTLNGPELIADSRTEMEALRAELKDMLEETTYQKLMEKETQLAQHLQETYKNVPLGIFVG